MLKFINEKLEKRSKKKVSAEREIKTMLTRCSTVDLIFVLCFCWLRDLFNLKMSEIVAKNSWKIQFTRDLSHRCSFLAFFFCFEICEYDFIFLLNVFIVKTSIKHQVELIFRKLIQRQCFDGGFSYLRFDFLTNDIREEVLLCTEQIKRMTSRWFLLLFNEILSRNVRRIFFSSIGRDKNDFRLNLTAIVIDKEEQKEERTNDVKYLSMIWVFYFTWCRRSWLC